MTLSTMNADELSFEETCRSRTLKTVEALVTDQTLAAVAVVFVRRKPLDDVSVGRGVVSISSQHAVACDSAFEAFSAAASLMVAAGDGYAVHLAMPTTVLPMGIGAAVAGDLADWTDDMPILRAGIAPDELRGRLREHSQRAYSLSFERDWRADSTCERNTMVRSFATDQGQIVWSDDAWSLSETMRSGPTTILNRAALYRQVMDVEEIRARLRRIANRLVGVTS